MKYTASTADISTDGVHRYKLTREWFDGEDRPRLRAAFVMLNPSTADADKPDATVGRCVGFAQRWGYDALDVINLSGLRSRDPKALRGTDPQDPINLAALHETCHNAHLVLCAWGGSYPKEWTSYVDRVASTLRIRHHAYVLGLNADGTPWHPLARPVRTTSAPLRWIGSREDDTQW